VVTETTLQSVQYLHLEPTEITWASSMSLIEIEELVEYLDLDPTVIDWETLTELIGIGLGQFATELGWDSATTLAAVRGLGLDPTGLDWGSSTGLGRETLGIDPAQRVGGDIDVRVTEVNLLPKKLYRPVPLGRVEKPALNV
jgi:hypothetical protein